MLLDIPEEERKSFSEYAKQDGYPDKEEDFQEYLKELGHYELVPWISLSTTEIKKIE